MKEGIKIGLGRESREALETELITCEADRESVEELFLADRLIENKDKKYDLFVANSLIAHGMFNVLLDHMNKFPMEFHANIMESLQEDEDAMKVMKGRGMLG